MSNLIATLMRYGILYRAQTMIITVHPQVVDARSKGRFLGTDVEPRRTLPSGHIVGAKNIPFTEVINPETKILKSKHELQEG